MSKSKTKARQVGPYSRDEVLSRVDRRTAVGKVMTAVERELTSDLGGDPTMGERLLIQAVAVKAARLHMLSDDLLSGDEPGGDGHHCLAWLNSLRLDIVALGLKRRARDIGLPGAPLPSAIHERARAVVVPEYEGAPA